MFKFKCSFNEQIVSTHLNVNAWTQLSILHLCQVAIKVATFTYADFICSYMAVKLLGAPSITYHSSEVVALEGDKLNLTCNATNDEDSVDPIHMSWYNGKQAFKPDGNHVIIYSKFDKNTDQLYSVLVFDPVNYSDDGEYICRAFNRPFCYTEKKINLTVECEFMYAFIFIISGMICIIYVYMCT